MACCESAAALRQAPMIGPRFGSTVDTAPQSGPWSASPPLARARLLSPAVADWPPAATADPPSRRASQPRWSRSSGRAALVELKNNISINFT